MRICLVCFHPSQVSGQVTSAVSLARALRQRGHQVNLLTTSGADGTSECDRGACVVDAVSVVRMLARLARVVRQLAVLSPESDIVQVNLPSPSLALVGDVLQTLLRRPIVVGFDAHLPLSEEVILGLSPGRSLAELTRYLPNYFTLARLSRFQASRYVVASRLQAAEIRLLGAQSPRVRVIPNLVDLERIGQTAGVSTAQSGPTIAYVGHFDHVKGVDLLIRALPIVRRSHPGARLLLAWSGFGPMNEIQQAIQETGMGDNVSIVGRVAIGETFRAATICALPYRSTSRQAAFPQVLLEALFTGVPLVTSDLPLIRELIEPGREAILARPGDVEDLARSITHLLDDEALRHVLVARQRQMARRYLAPSILVDRYEVMYEECLAETIGSGGSPPSGEPLGSGLERR